MSKDILLHICCAPCACYTLKALKLKDFDVTGFWFNPNIHPYSEYRMRLYALNYFEKQTGLKIIYNEEYKLSEWLQRTIDGWQNNSRLDRCRNCYRLRLQKTIEAAKDNNIKIFTTTMLYSKHLFHDEIKKIAEELASSNNIDFYYEDFRKGFKEGQELSKEYNLYRQKYCGCIFSEKNE